MAEHIPFPEEKVPMNLAKEYFLKRGITIETIEACGLQVASRKNCLEAIQSTRRTNYNAGIIIPYDQDLNYCTIRWLGDNISGFGTRLRDDPKLLAPKGPPRVYIPPIVDEGKFDGTLYICESAIKAICMAQSGYYAVAGNGVDGCFTNKGYSEGFPRWLFDASLVKRVSILFDSDWQSNTRVLGAIRRQAVGLRNSFGGEFPIVHKALGHDSDGNIQGIDDAIASKGIKWLNEWLASDEDELEIHVSELQEHLDALNAQYTICKIPICIIDKESAEPYTRGSFTDILESHRTFLQKNDNDRFVKINPAKEWLEWESHNIVDNLVYKPGRDVMGQNERGGTFYNSWRDCGVEAKVGDPQPFIDVYKNAIPDAEVRHLLFESVAWMLQNRDKKLDKAFLLIGSQVGTGKSLFVNILGEIFGLRNYSSIGVEDFTGSFNDSFVRKEIILLDDVTEMPRAVAGKFRRYVTDKMLHCNPKGIRQYDVENHAVWFITANKYRALPMDDNERRVLVVDFTPTTHYQTGNEWWNRFIRWLEGGGYSIVRHFFETMDISHFDPSYMPPMTETKQKVQAASRTAEEQFAFDLMHSPDVVLKNVDRSVFTPKELYAVFAGPTGDDYTIGKSMKLSHAMVEVGFNYAHGGKLCRAGGEPSRYWVIQNRDLEWDARAVKADVSAHRDVTPRSKI